MMGQELYARFIDAACRLRDGEAITYVTDGQTYKAMAPADLSVKNVVLKQVSTHVLFTVVVETTRSTQRAQTSADPEDPDFGLWTPGSEA